jgi:hypothetical protein
VVVALVHQVVEHQELQTPEVVVEDLDHLAEALVLVVPEL